MLNGELIRRGVPDVLMLDHGKKVVCREDWAKRRQEIIQLLCSEEYGFPPSQPIDWSYELLSEEKNFCAGNVTLTKILLKLKLKNNEFSFPFYSAIPNDMDKKVPAFVHICFRDSIPDKYMPTEEICDNGFAVFSFCYHDIVPDRKDGLSEGLGAVMYPEGKRNPDDCGTIMLWAWAASRVMDYVQTLESIDLSNIAVVGHSRLGKTALLAGGLDERFAYIISNDSGCSGAAITREKTGEHIVHITKSFPHWFCQNYVRYVGNEDHLPFDQHFLLALSAPRKVYVASATLDTWADPDSEYLSCVAASPVYELLGFKGFIHGDQYPKGWDTYHEGNIAYHLRTGTHYFGRYDWNRYMEYIKKQM
ncbi:MAG TPA: hypothetical protein DDZ89_05615 [Clostridiales bacterium]|nr:hypothetical protein [Clostridiales bacterium]